MARSTNREVDKHTAGAIVRFERDLAVELGPRKDVPIRQADVSVVAQRAIGIAQRLLKGYQVRAVPAREGLLTVLAVAVVSLGAVAGPAVVSRQAKEFGALRPARVLHHLLDSRRIPLLLFRAHHSDLLPRDWASGHGLGHGLGFGLGRRAERQLDSRRECDC